MIDYDEIVPLYHQIAKLLAFKIKQGEYLALSEFPTDNELCEMFNVSRPTVRQAVSYLVDKGYIVKRKGKKSLVTERFSREKTLEVSVNIVMLGVSDFITGTLYEKDPDICVKILHFSKIQPPPKIQSYFKLSEGDDVFHFERIRYLSGEPIAYVSGYLKEEIGNKISEQDLETFSITGLIEEKLGLKISTLDQAIEIKVVDEKLSKVMGMSISDPILHLSSAISIHEENFVQIHDTYFAPGRVKYKFKVSVEK